MKYTVTMESFDSDEFKLPISKIRSRSTKTVEKERWFKKIALSILKKNVFPKIVDGREITKRQGVSFDLVEKGNDALSLIELKGSQSTFNYSKKVQYARLHHVINELKKRNVKTQIFLFQINLKYDLYQILDYKFYSNIFPKIDLKNVGWDINNIDSIVDDITSWMAKAK